MNRIELETKFFLGGNATFTVDNGKGEHYTFKIRQPKRAIENKEQPYFVSLLTGPDNEHSYTYLGIVDPFGNFRLTKASKMNEQSKPVMVFKWAMKHVFGDKILPEGYQIRHAGKCGCCGRQLTEPLSLTIGIGPECRRRMGM